MLNTVLKLAALAGFVGSLAVLVIYVPHLDLAIVLVIVAAMATYDFLIRPLIAGSSGRKR